MFQEITKEELLGVLKSFQMDNSPGHDGWTVEFFLDFFWSSRKRFIESCGGGQSFWKGVREF